MKDIIESISHFQENSFATSIIIEKSSLIWSMPWKGSKNYESIPFPVEIP
jgi:hypothetical protein